MMVVVGGGGHGARRERWGKVGKDDHRREQGGIRSALLKD